MRLYPCTVLLPQLQHVSHGRGCTLLPRPLVVLPQDSGLIAVNLQHLGSRTHHSRRHPNVDPPHAAVARPAGYTRRMPGSMQGAEAESFCESCSSNPTPQGKARGFLRSATPVLLCAIVTSESYAGSTGGGAGFGAYEFAPPSRRVTDDQTQGSYGVQGRGQHRAGLQMRRLQEETQNQGLGIIFLLLTSEAERLLRK